MKVLLVWTKKITSYFKEPNKPGTKFSKGEKKMNRLENMLQ